jgi:hypothetical protein
MLDRWFYKHKGRIGEPVTLAGLQDLADQGQLSPTDLIWPSGKRPEEGIYALNAVNFPAGSAEEAAAPDWLGEAPPEDVSADELSSLFRHDSGATAQKTAGGGPDWLADVERAEQREPRGPDRAVRVRRRAPRPAPKPAEEVPTPDTPAEPPVRRKARSSFLFGVVVGAVGTLVVVGGIALAAWCWF